LHYYCQVVHRSVCVPWWTKFWGLSRLWFFFSDGPDGRAKNPPRFSACLDGSWLGQLVHNLDGAEVGIEEGSKLGMDNDGDWLGAQLGT
jgi:hypothetical protein